MQDYLRRELAALKILPKGTWLAVSKEHFTLFVMNDKEIVESFDVAVGKNVGQKRRGGDDRTPEGMFEITQLQDSSNWTHDFRDGKGVINGAYGPWFIRLKTGWNGIGIHGTHDTASIGTNASEGCIRLRNDELQRLKKRYIKIGMKVLVLK